MRDGTSVASPALRGGSDRVGACEPRALPGRGTQPGDGSARAQLRGFWASDPVGCELAPAEALKEKVVGLGTPRQPQK